MKTWEEEAIETIMEKFDFRKVKHIMDVLNFAYGSKKETPTVDDVRSIALNHLKESLEILKDPDFKDEKQFSSYTAGFRMDYNKKGEIRLSFEIVNAHYTVPGFYKYDTQLLQ